MSDNAPMVPYKVVSSRRFKHSAERLFDAFADGAKLLQWWGPAGFTNTFQQFDFHPGGAWVHTMHAPDGAAYENESKFLEIDRPDRIVFLHLGPVHIYTMTMEFIARGEGTELVWTMDSQNGGENEAMIGFIESANQQNFDKLAALLG
jgi:uncharacterized protein YndB with AHSA1/START domain